MNLPSQVQSIQNGTSLAEQAVLELNHELHTKFTSDDKVHENLGNQKSIETSNDCRSDELEDSNRKISSPRRTVPEHEHEHEMEDIQPVVCDLVGLQKLEPLPDDASKWSSLEQSVATWGEESKKLSQQANQKKGRPSKRKNIFAGSPRVLRSRSQDKSKAPELVNVPAQDVGSKEKKRRKKQIKKIPNNEFSKIRTHLRYLLTRISYEQNFIDAYVGEGWKGQSLEKIKPEKELERAKFNIIRYKVKTRNLFERIDKSFVEGRLPETLFDSEGLIDSEDIFCAKCGQKDVQLDNDIILCDGACERGFHQFCLEPPLLKEQVPAGDEGWLCPACDCKVDCVDLLNDSQGTDLSIGDSWEKVFPEAAASGNKLDDTLGLPSDDSEDDDYNPDGPEVDEEVDEEESSTDGSGFSSASEDLGAVANNEHYSGLPSEDSEDDDYDPDRVGSDKQAKSETSSSDFTSDSEDVNEIYEDKGGLAEVEGPSASGHVENSEKMPKIGMEDDGFEPITAKRHVKRLDYKKLHDETYGNVSSDSSDEDFTDTDLPRSRKHAKRADEMDVNRNKIPSESTPITTGKKLDVEETSSSPAHKGSSAPCSSKSTKSASRKLGEAATKRLFESFKENRYPNRNMREDLAKELKLTVNQVRKWFENARWSFKHRGGGSRAGDPLPESCTSMAAENAACNGEEKKPVNEASPEISVTTQQGKQEISTTPSSRKRKAKADHNITEIAPGVKEALPIGSPNPQDVRRSGRLQSRSAGTSRDKEDPLGRQ